MYFIAYDYTEKFSKALPKNQIHQSNLSLIMVVNKSTKCDIDNWKDTGMDSSLNAKVIAINFLLLSPVVCDFWCSLAKTLYWRLSLQFQVYLGDFTQRIAVDSTIEHPNKNVIY